MIPNQIGSEDKYKLSDDEEGDAGSQGSRSNLDANGADQKFSQHRIFVRRWRAVSFIQLAEWQRDNEYLHKWHRPAMPSVVTCFASIFRVHAETGNIWTHLLGAVFFIVYGTSFLSTPNSAFVNPAQEKLLFFGFFLGSTLCFSFSAIFHIMGDHSERLLRIFAKLDYSGISFIITGGYIPSIYYEFYCEPTTMYMYSGLIMFLGVTCMVVSFSDKFGTPQYRSTRAAVFVSLGLSGLFTEIQVAYEQGYEEALAVGRLEYLAVTAFLGVLGALLYACRIPEQFFPGQFDLVFQSHQLFHVLVLAAAVVHLFGLIRLQQHHFNNSDCSCKPTQRTRR